MNSTARILILVLIVGALVWIGVRPSQPIASTTPNAPDHHAKVIGFACDPNLGRPRADVSIQNTGQTTIEFPQAVVQFGSGTNAGYLQPNPLRPGGIASDSIYAPVKGASGCTLLSVQDKDGFPVSLN